MLNLNLLKFTIVVLVYVYAKSFDMDQGNLQNDHIFNHLHKLNPDLTDFHNPIKVGDPLPPVSPLGKECSDTMNQLQQDLRAKLMTFKQLSTDQASVLTGSGLFPGAFGRGSACKANPNTNYYIGNLINLDKDFIPVMSMPTAVCMPKTCNESDTVNVLESFTKILPPMKGPYWTSRFTTTEVVAINAKNKRSWFFWGYLAIFGAFTLITILFTIINQLRMQKKTVVLYQRDSIGDQSSKSIDFQGTDTQEAEKADDSAKNKQAQSKTIVASIIESFDVFKRMPTLIVSKRPNAESAAFDIIRVISMGWVIIAHQFSDRIAKNAGIMNLGQSIISHKHDWVLTYIEHGFYAVDFFLFMGGYVAIQSNISTINKFKGAKWWKWPALYFFMLIKRYVRILPIVAVIVFYLAYVFIWLSPENPTNWLWMGSLTRLPEVSWRDWSQFYAYDKTAMTAPTLTAPWFWYLVVDYQCYVIIPQILMACQIHKFIGQAICAILITSSIAYSLVISYQYKITLNPLDANWSSRYYFYWPCRMCVYFIGAFVAIIGMKPPKKQGQKPEDKKPLAKQNNTDLTTPDISVRSTLINDVAPPETARPKKKKWIISLIQGIFSFLIVATSFVLMNRYFQIGCDNSIIPTTVNMIWLTFGKIIFTTAVMVMLIQVCKTNKKIPKLIANNSAIQLIANLGFSMYGWHYIILFYSEAVSETYTFWSDYLVFGCFFWVFLFTFLIALWTSLIFEYPQNDLWRLFEVPFVNRLRKI